MNHWPMKYWPRPDRFPKPTKCVGKDKGVLWKWLLYHQPKVRGVDIYLDDQGVVRVLSHHHSWFHCGKFVNV